MPDDYVEQLTIQSVVFRVPQEYAALVVYVGIYESSNVRVCMPSDFNPDVPDTNKVIATVPPIKKMVNGKRVYVSVFLRLPVGTYVVTNIIEERTITLFPGFISEVDLG